MYQPPHFREDRPEIIHELIRTHPLATLVTVVEGRPEANHIPLLLDSGRGPMGTLRGHVARGNELAALRSAVDVLAIFQGPQAYVTPSWYETKRQTGKVVPTWNYVVVHAHGTIAVVDDKAWLRDQIEDLTDRHEAPRPAPWHVGDAPDEFLHAQMKGIVGIEIAITRLEGKWKMSQNRSDMDRSGVVEGLRTEAGGEGVAVADLVERFGTRR